MSSTKDSRSKIVDTFARWTALSALRSGSRIKSRHDIYPLLASVDFERWLVPTSGPSSAQAFEAWHRNMVALLVRREPRLGVGWAAKLLNVYLKTACYVGDLGSPEVRNVLHPPIDSGLWAGIAHRFAGQKDLLGDTHHVTHIRDIKTYDDYARIIRGCRRVASELQCRLIEVDQLWDPSVAGPITSDDASPRSH